MPRNREHGKSHLTIVNSGLLRTTADDWVAPAALFRRIQGKALALLLAATTSESKATEGYRKHTLLLFDCFLRVIDEPILSSALVFTSSRFGWLQLHFYGALGSMKFFSATEATRIQKAYTFYSMIAALGNSTGVVMPDYRQGAGKAIPAEFVEWFEAIPLKDCEVRALQPYLLTTKSGTDYNVLIGDLAPILGEEFTASFHSGLRTIAQAKAKDSALRDFGTTFARLVCERYESGEPDPFVWTEFPRR